MERPRNRDLPPEYPREPQKLLGSGQADRPQDAEGLDLLLPGLQEII